MYITVLSDAKAMDGFESEHGLSFLIETDGQEILFDTGASDLFKRNAEKLGIRLQEIDRIVLSHGHYDHGDGLSFLEDLPLLCHPGCFSRRYRKSGTGRLGIRLSREAIEKRFHLESSRDPVRLSEHLWFLGEVPRENDFEARYSKYLLEGGEEDYILDDSGMACITEQGLVVISGCAHSGICNMVDYARRVTRVDQVHMVIGGFHLQTDNPQCRRTIDHLKNLKIRRVCPSHCTMEPALGLFHQAFGPCEVLTGSRMHIA